MQVGNINSLVVDASVVLSFLLPDESHPQELDNYFRQSINGDVNFISSCLLHFEVINSLKMAIIRKRISLEYAQERISEFLNYEIEIKKVDFQKVFSLAYQESLTVYDASYLYLAQSQNLKLLSLDDKLLDLIV